jgi:hypothetical protein
LAPKVLRIGGKSKIQEIGVTAKDMPNMFVEAVTVSDGKVHTEVREIHVPPAKRVLNVELTPSAKEFRPREHAKVTLKLTDAKGKPFVGSTVLSIFDKSLEYISGGSNVPEIKEFFWKWRREHRPYLETNLERYFANLVPQGKEPMESLGVFGDTVADDKESDEANRDRIVTASGPGRSGGVFFNSFGARAVWPWENWTQHRPNSRQKRLLTAVVSVRISSNPRCEVSSPTRRYGSRRWKRTMTASPRWSSTCQTTSPRGKSRPGQWVTARASATLRPKS